MSPVVHDTKAQSRQQATVQCSRSLTLRCLAYRDSISYVAECLDLNLLVRRESAEQAMQSLEEAIRGYLLSVLDTKQDLQRFVKTGSIDGLLPRPSPLSHRIRYHMYLVAALVSGNRRSFQLNEYPSSRFLPAYC